MTKTIPSDIRKAAKRLAREQGIPYQTALDVAARGCGHSGWGAVLAVKAPPVEPFLRLVHDLWKAGGTDMHIEPWFRSGGAQAQNPQFDDVDGAMNPVERHVFLHQLSTMMIARVPIATALKVLREQHGHRIGTAAAALEAGIASGHRLHQLMFEDAANFPEQTRFIIKAGPDGPGGTAHAIRRAAEHEERILASAAVPVEMEGGPSSNGAKVLFRIHGVRRMIETIDAERHMALKRSIIQHMVEWHEKRSADGSIDVEIDGTVHTFQIASSPANGDHRFVLRMPDRRVRSLRLDQLGIRDLDAWMRICRSGPGLVMVSGKTSSGKSTTIAKTIDALRAEGIDAVAEEQNGVFHEDRIQDMVAAAATRTVILEGYGSSLDRAIANAMNFGLGNGDLARLFRGGMHQELLRQRVGPQTLDTMILPWS